MAMDASRTGAAALTQEDREELERLRARDRVNEHLGHAPTQRRLELEAEALKGLVRLGRIRAARGLRALRIALGLDFSAVADSAEIRFERLDQIEHGTQEVATDDELRALASALAQLI